MLKKYQWGFVFSIMLTAFTVYAVLDTFLIPRAITEAAPRSDSDNDGQAETQAMTEESSTAPFTSDTEYSDDNIHITITQKREYNTEIYIADVVISSPDYIYSAFADNLYGKNITAKTSEIAKENSAILAINGDNYGSRESGYVIRNGVLYRSAPSACQTDFVLFSDGSAEIIAEADFTAEELLECGAVHTFSFGPALTKGGEITVGSGDEVSKSMTSNPRTAVGIISDCHYVFVVSDGRTSQSEGLSLLELAGVMRELGAECSYNLDGGGSSTMVFCGNVVNNPTTNGRVISERSINDALCIGY